MISILIPTYNYNVFPLAKEIEKLAIKENIPFEIICIDDGSASKLNLENNKINQLTNGLFIQSTTNKGLSVNRNNLANKAKYKNLLFIDGDSEIINTNFISNYINVLKENPDVIYGGRVHPEIINPERKLRWKYGKYHEDLNIKSRKKSSYKSILFNNTVIKKKVFNQIYFNSKIKQYGHEDTIFAFQLSQIKAKIMHIENPVLHGDVDLNFVFYKKMHRSIENLNFIYRKNLIDPNFIRFLNLFTKLKKVKLNFLFASFYVLLKPIFKLNLTSKHPSLFIFNLFRISYFCHINLKK